MSFCPSQGHEKSHGGQAKGPSGFLCFTVTPIPLSDKMSRVGVCVCFRFSLVLLVHDQVVHGPVHGAEILGSVALPAEAGAAGLGWLSHTCPLQCNSAQCSNHHIHALAFARLPGSCRATAALQDGSGFHGQSVRPALLTVHVPLWLSVLP